MGQRRDSATRRNEQQGDKRDQRRCERNRRETVAGVEGGPSWRADREGGVHRRPDPGHDLARVLWPGERQPPGEGTCDDEALRCAEHRPAKQQDGD